MKTVFLARSVPVSWISRVGDAVAITFSFLWLELFRWDFGLRNVLKRINAREFPSKSQTGWVGLWFRLGLTVRRQSSVNRLELGVSPFRQGPITGCRGIYQEESAILNTSPRSTGYPDNKLLCFLLIRAEATERFGR